MNGKRQGPDVQEAPSESVHVFTSRIRSLIADERISSARHLADVAVQQHPDSAELKALLAALYPGDVTRAHLRDSSHRANMEWLTQHQEEHRGKWVALLQGKLVADEADLGELMAILSSLGSDRRPLIHHIPDQRTGPRKTVLPSDFATGASTFADTAPGTLYEARIFVPVRVAGVNVDVTAMVDTAAPWCVLEGALATLLVDQEAILVKHQVLSSRFGELTGDLCRSSITLLADEGDSLTIESTVFVCPDWPGPNVIGYNGLLERTRFAVDPSANMFYFGLLQTPR